MSAKSKRLARGDLNLHQWERKQPSGTQGGWVCKRCNLVVPHQAKPAPNYQVIPIGDGDFDQYTCDEGVVMKLMNS